MNCKRKSRRRLFLLMRSRTPPISSEFRGGFEHLKPPLSVRHWCSRVLLEKLTGCAASQEIPCTFGIRRFITVLTSARHLSLSWANSIQSLKTTFHYLKVHLNIILPSASGSPQYFPHTPLANKSTQTLFASNWSYSPYTINRLVFVMNKLWGCYWVISVLRGKKTDILISTCCVFVCLSAWLPVFSLLQILIKTWQIFTRLSTISTQLEDTSNLLICTAPSNVTDDSSCKAGSTLTPLA